MKRIILEMGMGNDLYGEDYTKAACRAVEDAIKSALDNWYADLSDNQKDRINDKNSLLN